MPRMTGQVSVGANAVSANQLSGKLYENLNALATVLLAAAAAAVGVNCTLLINGVAVVNDEPISRANRFPIIPDDVVTEEVGIGRLILTFRNTTGAAIVVDWSVDVDFGA